MSVSAFVLFAQSQGDPAAGATGLAGLICFIGVGLLLYFLPTFIAAMRGHQNGIAIFILNLLLGWTFLGWVAALVWSFTVVERVGRRRRPEYDD
jgi:hypothetical protein